MPYALLNSLTRACGTRIVRVRMGQGGQAMNNNYLRYYVITVLVVLSANTLLAINGLPRLSGIGWIVFVGLVLRAIQEWRSAGGKRDNAVQEARELDQSWTEHDKQVFKQTMDQQRRP
jgi:hypothetical protein